MYRNYPISLFQLAIHTPSLMCPFHAHDKNTTGPKKRVMTLEQGNTPSTNDNKIQ